jgi:heat shock protein HslJ
MSPFIRMIVGGLAALSVGVLTVCAAPSATRDLDGTWELVEIDSRPIARPTSGERLTFTIKGSTIEGFDGCNTFSGRLDQPGGIASTRRGCADDIVKLPLDLANAKSHLEAGRIDGERLLLPARPGIPASVFARIKTARE